MTVTWHRAHAGEVPADVGWLTIDERAVLDRLSVPKRRADWRLGRWTAKSLLAAVVDVPFRSIEIRAAADGAPEAVIDGLTMDLSLSLSHRGGVAVAATSARPSTVGIDLETLEARSDAFVREWLSVAEQSALPGAGEQRDLRVLCCWTGKEASAKVLREGLRLDVRRAEVVPGSGSRAGWAPIEVRWRSEAITHRGWWLCHDREVIAVVTDPPSDPPRRAVAGRPG